MGPRHTKPITGHWRLPDGVEELMPADVVAIESLRRRALDLFHGWGYETVIPPLIEYLDSLLTGTGNDLELQTFKLTDQLTGRTMGVRADMTPQVARIDAHRMGREGPVRLCYLGSVLHTRPEIPGGTRSPIQVGAELYGHATLESDLEVIRLMLELVALAGGEQVVLDLGHVGIYRTLIASADLDPDGEAQIFAALQRKATADLEPLLQRHVSSEALRQQLLALNQLNGGVEVLSQARAWLPPSVHPLVAQLERVAATAERQQWGVELHVDLAELRGFDYHTGVLFAAYLPRLGSAVASGGRYDNVGAIFGRARPATGFSADLKTLVALTPQSPARPSAIFAPAQESETLEQRVAELRQQGERVVVELPGQQQDAAAMGCDRQLVETTTGWEVSRLNND